MQPCRSLRVRNMQRAVMSETLHHLSSINTSVRCMYGTERTGLPLEHAMVACFLWLIHTRVQDLPQNQQSLLKSEIGRGEGESTFLSRYSNNTNFRYLLPLRQVMRMGLGILECSFPVEFPKCMVIVLVSAGTELTFFLVAGTVLCFGFSVRMMLITLWSFSCC